MSLVYRSARPDDARDIAALHAESWRTAYRGAYSDEYLDGDVFEDRIDVWTKRMSAPAENQFVVLAVDDGQLAGFACAYGNSDERWGTFLDNIHVRPDRHGRGIGSGLMSAVASWSLERHPGAGLYLNVLEQNTNARRFYEGLGASDQGGDVGEPPGGGSIAFRYYVWTDISSLAVRG